MCGIAGLIRLDGSAISSSEIISMTDSIAHRGPDGQGQWIEKNIGLGHRRLAIIDLTDSGKQPMFSLDNRFVLVYNGEIYNFKKLRGELESLGYQFSSRTDSEVVLNSIIQWGVEAIPRFNGMFAFAFWDRKLQKLLLARDRYGIKPLYISKQGESIAFASEQKAMFANGYIRKKLDLEGMYEYLNFQNIFTNKTFNQDVQMVSPGHYATLNLGIGETEFRFTKYWDFHFEDGRKFSDRKEYAEELDRLLLQAVNRQLVSDVELGSYLSGGMDSASITAMMAQSLYKFKTFTCGFDLTSASSLESDMDERSKALALARSFNTEHYETLITASDFENSLERIVWHLEEPRVGQSYPNFYAAQLASRHVKVVLSGTGGDELFGGYPWRYFRDVKFEDTSDFVSKNLKLWQRLLTPEELTKLTAPIKNQVSNVDISEILRDLLIPQNCQPETTNDYINLSLRFEAKTFLHGLLVVEDKLSMAHGVETRIPFLDNDLVDFAMQCPVEFKLSNRSQPQKINGRPQIGSYNSNQQQFGEGKRILRESMAKYLPRETLEGRKQGFSGPDSSWFKTESIQFVKKALTNQNSPIFDYLNYETTNGLLNQHLNGQHNRRLLIWSLLNLNQILSSY
jgi:asparagine synthase (glutamine-hydrolysing)